MNDKRNLLLLATTLVVTILALEGVLMISHRAGLFPDFFRMLVASNPSFDLDEGDGLYYSHPYISYEARPGYETSDGYHITEQGFRGESFSARKPEGTYRIVALGGSTTYGIYGAWDEAYPYQLQQQLRESLGTDQIEVLNAGLVSATSAESLVRFYMRVLPVEPDMILLYEGYNDLNPRMFDDFRDDYYHFRKTPRMEKGLLSGSYLFRLVEQSILGRFLPDRTLRNSNLVSHTWRLENLPESDEEKIRNFDATSADVYRRNLEYIIESALARGIIPVVGTFAFDGDFPHWNELMPDVLWEKGILQENEVIRELAATYRLRLCPFYEYGLTDPAIFDDSIHMNAYGNGKKAECFREVIEDLVRDALIPPGDGESGGA